MKGIIVTINQITAYTFISVFLLNMLFLVYVLCTKFLPIRHLNFSYWWIEILFICTLGSLFMVSAAISLSERFTMLDEAKESGE